MLKLFLLLEPAESLVRPCCGLWTQRNENAIVRGEEGLDAAAQPLMGVGCAMTVGTRIYTWLNGELVGTDEFGNRYFRAKRAPLHGRERRWCLYKGLAEASKVPPEWHAWLHHTTDDPLTERAAKAPDWHKPHQPNLTGTSQAYRPKGHDYQGGRRAAATGDYEAWVPE